MSLKQTMSLLFSIYLLGVSSPCQETKFNNQEVKIQAELLQAEDSRDETRLVKLIARLKTGMSEIAEQMAQATGRIPSFNAEMRQFTPIAALFDPSERQSGI